MNILFAQQPQQQRQFSDSESPYQHMQLCLFLDQSLLSGEAMSYCYYFIICYHYFCYFCVYKCIYAWLHHEIPVDYHQ